MSREQEDEAVKLLEMTNHKRSMGLKDEPVRISDILFTRRMKDKFHAWRETLLPTKLKDTSSADCSQKESNQQFETIFYKMRPALSLTGFTFHQMILIQSVILICSVASLSIFSVRE